MCFALAVGLWGLWLTATAASFALSLYAMSLAGLSLAVAALAAAVGALVAVGVFVYLEWRWARRHYNRVIRSGVYQLDEALSAELGVEVYKCTRRCYLGASALFPKPRIAVNSEAFSEEEQRAVAYHEYSHIKRREFFVKEALKGAAKASAAVVAFQLALAAGFGGWAYFAAAAIASLVWARDVAELLDEKRDILHDALLSSILFSIPAALLARLLPPGPAPQIGPLDALAALLASAGAFLFLALVDYASELLADAEAALAVGPGPVLNALAKTREIEREAAEDFKRELVERGAKYPTLRYLVHRLLDTHPPTSLRMWLMRLCVK